MSLYHKYRPDTLDAVVGNEVTKSAIKTMIEKEDRPHAILLSGPSGCGKTTIARIIAKMLGCEPDNFREMDTADFRGIDTVREIRQASAYRPLGGGCYVWLLDECHKLTNDAQNALLKSLEDTPSHVYFILATTDPQNLLPTVRGRCTKFEMNLLNDTEMMTLLRRVVRAEGETLVKLAYEQIVANAEGHGRNALQILEAVLAVDADSRIDVANRFAEQKAEIVELCRALVQGSGWKKVASILKKLQGEEPESVRRAVLGYCTSCLLKQTQDSPVPAMVIECFSEPTYNTGWAGIALACYSATHDA